MRIFALETNMRKLTDSFLSPEEKLVAVARFHGFLFFLRSIRSFFVTLAIVAAIYGAWYAGAPLGISAAAAILAWIIFAGVPVLRAFIDWRFDELVITSEKIVIVDQSSLLHQEIKQMNLENLASVKARTQYWGLVPFGILHFDLKEGTGKAIELGYIPHVQRVASLISDVLIKFQRRQAK